MNAIEDNTNTNNDAGSAIAIAAPNDVQEQEQKQDEHRPAIPTPTPTISRLPVLVPRPHPHQPIRALDAESFADLHLAHLTSDVPDSVLFPFLHGLEGDNGQQNAFFAASSGLDMRGARGAGVGVGANAEGGSSAAVAGMRGWNACGSASRSYSPNVVKVPEYRGLLWVACDEEQLDDEERMQAGYVFDPHLHSFSQPARDSAEFEDEDFDFDEYEDEEFEDASDEQDEVDDASEDEHMGELMQLDDDVDHHSVQVENKNNCPESNNDNADPNDATHMHPQALRKPTASAPIAIQTGPHFARDHSSHHYASSSSHHHDVPYAHTQHHHSTINFPTSSSSPASLASPSVDNAEGFEYDHEGVRRLSTSSISTAETVSSSASASTSASDSAHSHFGFQDDSSFGFGSRASGGDEGFVASASYSTTASSIVDSHFKHDEDGELDVLDSDISSPTSTTSPTDTDTDADLAGLTTPCTSPMTDINIDDCIPSVSSLPPLTSSDLVMPSTPATAVPSYPPPPYTAQSSTSTITVVSAATAAALTSTPKAAPSTAANEAPSSGSVSPVPLTPDVTDLGSISSPSSNSQSKSPSPAPVSTVESPPTLMSAEELKRLTVTSSFRTSDLLTIDPRDGRPMFLPPRVPDGISLRNFGIQVPIYATLSDIVVYCASGNMKSRRAAFNLAEKFKLAIEKKAMERQRRYEEAGVEVVWVKGGRLGNVVREEEEKCEDDMDVEEGERRANETDRKPKAYLVSYNVFVLSDPLPVLAQKAPWMLSRLSDPDSPFLDDEFLRRINPTTSAQGATSAPSDTPTSDPVAPMNSDSSTNTHLEENEAVKLLKDEVSPTKRILPAVDFAQRERDEMRELTKATPILGECVYLGNVNDVPLPQPRPRAQGSSVRVEEIDLLRDGEAGPSGEQQQHRSEEEMMEMEMEMEDDPFDGSDNPMGFDVCIECRDCARIPSVDQLAAASNHLAALDAAWTERRYQTNCLSGSGSTMKRTPRPPPSASQVVHLYFPASPPCFSYTMVALNPVLDFLSGLVSPRQNTPSTRQKKVLIYSSDGYTESSVLALSLLMKERALDLPGAYLELQVEKGRSFFVYQSDLGMLKRIEAHLQKQRIQFNAQPASSYSPFRPTSSRSPSRGGGETGERRNWDPTAQAQAPPARETGAAHPYARSPRNSISYPASVNGLAGENVRGPPAVVPSQGGAAAALLHGRPRALTSPMLFPHIDHQTWFNDPRFDGSFPSRVLPFLYLGNLNHAQNAYMLHALGITHVVSVGECALVPPANIATDDSSSGYHLVAGRGPGGHGSLWMEEREGRIKVLDIKGVCDDGIDSLQHQLAPVCEWMEKAREEGGKILVHCRVGVSRSATVTIAYVMKHLEIPLVDAYLIVRSRRLNVLIQPNMRLLYNLCGWEVELARDRAKGDVSKLRRELSRSLNWPYLAREVHRLNEKYLH